MSKKKSSEKVDIVYIGFQIPTDVMNKLRILADKEDRSVSYVARRILKEYTENNE